MVLAGLAVFVFIFSSVLTVNAAEGDENQKTITPADLGVNDVGVLPSSKWYFLKEFSRSISRFFTFTAVGKAELEMEIANEKAAEALSVQEESPDDQDALLSAIENYTDAGERLRARLSGLNKVTDENPKVEKLLLKLDEHTLKHAVLLNQLAERWNTDPYVEDANVVNPKATRDNHLQGAVDIAQKKIQEVVDIGVQKETNIEEKAAAQIDRAETAIKELESALAEFAKTGPIRIDSTPARISTNLTIERQTPKRDFGDRMKAGLETAGGMLANGKMAFAEGKFGEAFGIARAAEVHVLNTSRVLAGVLRADQGGLEDGEMKITPPQRVGPVPPFSPPIKGLGRPLPNTEPKASGETTISPSAGEVQISKPATVSPVPSPVLSPSPSQSATITPPPADTYGYSFKISGFVHDVTDAPEMTNGTPIPGVVIRATGPTGATAQTQSNGAYTLVFTNAGEGTYEMCIVVPSGYTPPHDPSVCEGVTVRLVGDKTLELTVNGNAALHNTGLNYNLMREQATTLR